MDPNNLNAHYLHKSIFTFIGEVKRVNFHDERTGHTYFVPSCKNSYCDVSAAQVWVTQFQAAHPQFPFWKNFQNETRS